LVVSLILAGACTASALAQGAPAAPVAGNGTGLVLGVRAGFGLPFGKTDDDTSNSSMSDGVTGMIPLWLDVGYRLNPNVQIGAFLQYGFALLNKDKAFSDCKMSGVSCSGSDLVIGASGQYHLMLESVDPWVGIGVGYERLGFTMSAQGAEVSVATSGLNFLNLQAGADFQASPGLGVGPFVSFSAGQYSSNSGSGSGGVTVMVMDPKKKAMHEWLLFGVRGVFNL
jgi:hypothetical protein